MGTRTLISKLQQQNQQVFQSLFQSFCFCSSGLGWEFTFLSSSPWMLILRVWEPELENHPVKAIQASSCPCSAVNLSLYNLAFDVFSKAEFITTDRALAQLGCMIGNTKWKKALMKFSQTIFTKNVCPKWKYWLSNDNYYFRKSREKNNPVTTVIQQNMHSLSSKQLIFFSLIIYLCNPS